MQVIQNRFLTSLTHETFEGKGTSGNYCKQSMDRRNVRNVYYYNNYPPVKLTRHECVTREWSV